MTVVTSIKAMGRISAMAIVMCLTMPSAFYAQETDPLGEQVWKFASRENTKEALELFIKSYPESPYFAEAEAQLAALDDFDARLALEAQIFSLIGPITFDSPLEFGADEIVGRSIAEILESSPTFPPVEGLPESFWKAETCASCHTWTQEALCTQSQNYINMDPARYQVKPHPFGGTLKINLRHWAQNDCR